MLHALYFFDLRYIIALALVIFLYGVYLKSRLWRTKNYWSEALRDISSKLGLLFRYTSHIYFLKKKDLNKRYTGTMHAGMYLGLTVFVIVPAVIALIINVIQSPSAIIWFRNVYLGFEFFFDIIGIFILAGAILAILRRLWIKPESLETRKGDFIVPGFLISIVITGFLLEGLRLTNVSASKAVWSILGFAFSKVLPSPALATYDLFIWIHAGLVLAFAVLIPYTRLNHLFTSSLNAFFSSLGPRGELSTPFDLKKLMESESFEVKIGTDRIDDFGWKQRLSLDACVNCGRCQDVCPAYAAQRPLSPKQVIQKLKKQMVMEYKAKGKIESKNLFEGIIGEDEVWACTTCWSCPESCPVLIDQLSFIVDFRRMLVSESKLDKMKTDVLMNFAEKSNPYGLPAVDRANWMKGLAVKTLQDNPNVEYLYWVGCASSYDSRNQNIAKSMVKILSKAGVSFGILGVEEKCCGETLRRMGEEGRFQQLVLENVEILKNYGVKKIIVHCPHGYNTLKNEYPRFGGKFEVIHHSQFLLQLIEQKKIKTTKKLEEITVFHDPCYLGRYNGIYDDPRRILGSAAAKLRELPRSRELSFCCGGGGGNSWYEVPEKERISVIRLREVEQAGAELLTVACPYCISMFEDAARIVGLEGKIKVKDISELVAELLEN